MKKKSLLVFLLAMASTTAIGAAGCDNHEHDWKLNHNADLHWYDCECGVSKNAAVHVDEKNNETSETGKDGKCDVCGADVHIHEYTIKSDDDSHWQECVFGEKANIGGHIDFINNETQAEGKDGKCDVCGKLSKVVVTFNTKGLGEAPEAKRVDYGTLATPPAAPRAQGYVFAGWYADADCKTPFDFATTAITADTVVYANWTEDTTPGSSSKIAIELELDSEAEKAAFGENEKLFFKFTAENDGRYSIMLQSGVSQNSCTFTTSLDEEDVEYKNAETKIFDLLEGETVIIEVTRGANVAANQNVGVYVSNATDEALPEDGWVSGEYVSADGNYTLVLDRAAKTVKWGNFDPVALYYVGGIVDEAKFTINENNFNGVFTVKDNDGVLHVTCDNTTLLPGGEGDFEIPTPIVPIPVNKFSGVYSNTTGGVYGAVEIGIYADGSGYSLNADDDRTAYNGNSAQFDQETNTLSFNSYVITVNLDDNGDAESITVTYGSNSAVYTRTGDSGDKLPESFVGLVDGTTYAGSDMYFTYTGEYTLLGGYQIRLYSYTQSTNTYTVKVNDVTYIVTIEGTDDVTVKWMDEEGELIDTLKEFAVDGTLPATQTNVTKQDSDFVMDLYHMTVQTEGWYIFTTEQTDLEFYVFDPYFNYLDVSEGARIVAGKAVYLTAADVEEGTAAQVVAVSKANLDADSVSFTVVKTETPQGYAANNPATHTGIGTVEVGELIGGFNYYLTYDLPQGNYLVTVSYDGGWGVTYGIGYTLNGVECGYYYGAQHCAITAVDESGKLQIVIDEQYRAIDDLTVNVEKDYTVQANAIEINKLGAHEISILEDVIAVSSSYVKVTAPANCGYVLHLGEDAQLKPYFRVVDGDYNGYDSENKTYSLAAGQSVTIAITGEEAGTATLIIENDYSDGAVELEFTKIPMGSSIISFTSGGSTGTSKNYLMPDTVGNDIFATASGAFTVNYPDGTKTEATLDSGSYIVTIPATEGTYFNVTATQSVDLFFATSYGAGSQGNPKNVTLNGLTYLEAVERGTAVYLIMPVGSYSYSSNDYGYYSTLYVNDKQVTSNSFDVKEGDVIRFEVSGGRNNTVEITFTALVPTSMRGEYTYMDNSDKKDLTIGTNSVTVGEKEYTLSGIRGSVYTFTNGTGNEAESITITAGATLLFGTSPLTSKVIPSNVVGTYTATTPMGEFTLTINANYTAIFVGDEGEATVNLSLTGNTYSFTYGSYDDESTFTVGADGTINMLYGYYHTPVTLTKEAGLSGTYTGVYDGYMTISLTFSDDSVLYVTDAGALGGRNEYEGFDLSQDGDTYSFNYSPWEDAVYPCTVTVNPDGSIAFKDDYIEINLTKE